MSDPAVRAEAALLGAILADEDDHSDDTGRGRRLADVAATQWRVGPQMLQDPWHQEVWAAIRRVVDAGEVADPLRVQREIRERGEGPTRWRADAPRLMELVDAGCRPAHASRYAGIVVEAAMHRRTHDLAGVAYDAAAAYAEGDVGAASEGLARMRDQIRRMRSYWLGLEEPVRAEVVRSAPLSDPAARARMELAELSAELSELGEEGPLGRAVGRLLGAVDAIANTSIDAPRSPEEPDRVHLVPGQMLDADWLGYYQELARAAEEHPDADVPVLAEEEPARGVIAPEADRARYALADTQREAEQAKRAEERASDESALLATAIAHPEVLDRVEVAPGDIADERLRAGVELVRDMHASGVPVDPVTVAWSARQHGVTLPDLPAEEPAAAEAPALARRIARAAQVDRLEQAGDRMRAAAINPAGSPEQMLTAAHTAVEPIQIEAPAPEREAEPATDEPEREVVPSTTAPVS